MVPAMMSTVDDEAFSGGAGCCCWWWCNNWWWCISGQVRSSSMYRASGMTHDDCGIMCNSTTLLSWPRADSSLISDYKALRQHDITPHYHMWRLGYSHIHYQTQITSPSTICQLLLDHRSYTLLLAPAINDPYNLKWTQLEPITLL